MSSQIKLIKQFVKFSDISKIYEYAQSVDKSFTDYGNVESEFTYHSNFKNQEIVNLINSYLPNLYDFVVDNYGGEFIKPDISKTHLAKFETGPGMHEHFDSTKPNDIATLIYINDDYSGGNIYFPDHKTMIRPQAGDLICFPDTPDFVHGVKPITDGVRYTIPRWFTRIV